MLKMIALMILISLAAYGAKSAIEDAWEAYLSHVGKLEVEEKIQRGIETNKRWLEEDNRPTQSELDE